MSRNLTAQEIYDAFYMEACNRARAKGEKLPDEVEVFKVLVKAARTAVADGDAPIDFLEELAEVKPQVAQQKELAHRLEERERALREGILLDLEDLYK